VPMSKFIKASEELVEEFMRTVIKGTQHFRYFSVRPVSVIVGHLVTVLLQNNAGVFVAYGHLERERGRLWLGLAVADNYQGQGYGTQMLRYLINSAFEQQEEAIYLSVDKSNDIAIRLYIKKGFFIIDDLTDKAVYKLLLN
jgi:ribosomal protein S18 acetylase RimI-like enzyme